MRSAYLRTLAGALAAAALLPGALAAQTAWLGLRVPSGFTIEAIRPSFEEDGLSTLSSAWFGSLRLDAGSLRLVAELPFAHAGYDSDEADGSNAVGNVYLGMDRRWERTALELGIRLPTAQDGEMASFVGIYADPDRMNAFFPDVAEASLVVSGEFAGAGSPVTVRLRGGPAARIYTGDESSNESFDLLLNYGVQAWYGGPSMEAGGGITGVAILTEEDLTFGERTFHQAGATLNLLLGGVRPGINVRVPLDDDLDFINFTLGLHLTVLTGAR